MLITIVILVSIFGTAAFAQGNGELTKTYEVRSEEEVPQEITEAGQDYELKDVQLVSAEKEKDEILHKEITATKSISNLVVKVAEFPLTQTVETEDGYKGVAYRNGVTYEVDNEHSVFGRSKEIEYEMDHGYLHETPTIEPYIEQDHYDLFANYLVHVNLPLIKTEIKDVRWMPGRYYKLRFEADDSGEYYLPIAGKIINIHDAAPGVEYQEDILWLMGLENDYYRIKGVEWEDEVTPYGDGVRRVAKYEIEEKEQKWVSYYGRTLELPTVLRYTATAHYSGTAAKAVPGIDPETEGLYTATAIYTVKEAAVIPSVERPEPPAPSVPIQELNYTPYIAVGAAAAGSIIFVFFWRRRKNINILQWNSEAEAYKLLGRMRVIPTEPIEVNVTKYADGLPDVTVLIRTKLIRRAQGRPITIICGGNRVIANTEIERGFSHTQIS